MKFFTCWTIFLSNTLLSDLKNNEQNFWHCPWPFQFSSTAWNSRCPIFENDELPVTHYAKKIISGPLYTTCDKLTTRCTVKIGECQYPCIVLWLKLKPKECNVHVPWLVKISSKTVTLMKSPTIGTRKRVWQGNLHCSNFFAILPGPTTRGNGNLVTPKGRHNQRSNHLP